MSQPFIGQISIFGFNFAPRGWAFCAGQVLSIAQNTALFSLLGTMYGGNGQTTFGLPDLRGRVPNSFGQGPGLQNYSQGQASGSESVTLNVNQMPGHTHTFAPLSANATADAGKPNGNVPASVASYTAAANVNGAMAPGNTGPAGGSQPASILQPYLTLNFCIALEGIFPSRN